MELTPTSYTNSCIYSDHKLPDGCILERILAIQKLDQIGLDFYQKMAEQTKLDKSSNYASALLHEINKQNCAKCVINKSISNCIKGGPDKCNAGELLDFVPYLVASVANDCSFMLTYRKMTEW